ARVLHLLLPLPHSFVLSPTRCRTHLAYVFLTAPATPEIYTLSLHDALPISPWCVGNGRRCARIPSMTCGANSARAGARTGSGGRSEEHTSELQSRGHLVCRLLLEKKKTGKTASDTRLQDGAGR